MENSAILHILCAVYRLSSPRLLLSIKYPFPPVILIWIYLLLSSFPSNELCTSVEIRDLSILCGIDVINEKLCHSVCLICSVQIISTSTDVVYEYPFPPLILIWRYLLLPSLLLNELCTCVAIRDFSILCGIDVINQKLYNSSYLICSVQVISSRIDLVYKIPISTCNLNMDISVTSISPLE